LVIDCPCPGGGQGSQACADDGSHWEACECADDTGDSETTGDPGACPIPELSLAAAGSYEPGGIAIFFDVGLEGMPPYECFSTGTELYMDSRIDLAIPGGGIIVSMPDDYIEQPANLEVEPIRGWETFDLAFGDAFQGSEMSPNLSNILAENPTLDGYVKLCNIDGACDDMSFTLGS
jgi:hypothetical protein